MLAQEVSRALWGRGGRSRRESSWCSGPCRTGVLAPGEAAGRAGGSWAGERC